MLFTRSLCSLVVVLCLAGPADAKKVVDVMRHDGTVCAVTAEGQLLCSGWPTAKELLSPVNGAQNVVAATLDGRHLCWRQASGAVRCKNVWDGKTETVAAKSKWLHAGHAVLDASGTLLVPTAQGFKPQPLPFDPVAAAHDEQGSHGCALRVDGQVACWGRYRGAGEGHDVVGKGDTRTYADMGLTLIAGIEKATRVVVGSEHTCVLEEKGTVKCWGSGLAENVGLTYDETNQGQTVVVKDLTGVTALTAGGALTCATVGAGDITCFGATGVLTGQLFGSGHVVLAEKGFTKVDASASGLCGIRGNQVTCVGGRTRTHAVRVHGVKGAVGVAVGYQSSCTWDKVGTVMCFGAYDDEKGAPPTALEGLRAKSVAMSPVSSTYARLCILDQNGVVHCRRDTWMKPALPKADALFLSQHSVCAKKQGATSIHCEGFENEDVNKEFAGTRYARGFKYECVQRGTELWCGESLKNLRPVLQLAVHVGEGKLAAAPSRGELLPGFPSPMLFSGGRLLSLQTTYVSEKEPNKSVWVPVLAGETFVRVAGDKDFACGITRKNGDVFCNGGFGARAIAGLPGGATDISVSGNHACAVARAQVYCWGENETGQLGAGDAPGVWTVLQ